MIGQSYWDTVTSGRSIGVGSGPTTGATGLTTSQMQNPANYATTYAGWDFANVWSAPSAGYYPQLYGVNYVLRVDPANALRAYGDANPAFTYTFYGLHTGDTSAILAGLSLSTAATTTSNVGSYAITAGGSVISTAGQAYRLIQTPAALTVTPRAITVTADAKSRAYGDANPALTYQVGGSGLVNGDTLSGALATSATTASNVGTYGITQGTLAASGNYALNYAGANLTVGQRALTVTADAKSRAYGDVNPALTYQVGGSGLVNGDTPVGCAGDVGDNSEQCRRLRHQAGHAGGLRQLCAELCERQPDRQPARDHGDGRCQEPRLWRRQPGADLSGRRLRPGQRRQPVGCAGDVGDDSQQCRHLRHQAGHAGGVRQLRAELYERQPDRRPARAHGDGRCQEPRLWRRQSGADLSGRRLGPGQWRHAVGCAGDIGDDSQQYRHLRHRAGHAGSLRQLRAELYERQPDRRPARAHGDGRCQEPGLWRRQSGADLSGRRLRPGQRRQPVGCAGDIGDDIEQCRHLRHHAGHARGLRQLRAELCERRPDRRPARAHGDGRCQEPRLWRRQSGADLSGRRLGPGQRRHACRVRWRHRRRLPATSASTASSRARWQPPAIML